MTTAFESRKPSLILRTYALSIVCLQIAASIALGIDALAPEPVDSLPMSDEASVSWDPSDLMA